jgi:hypothetical protein
MHLATLDLERELGVQKGEWSSNPHVLREFFRDRKIPNTKIAKILQVSAVTIGYWLNGNIAVPDRRDDQIHTLAREILDWEREHGRKFNSEK